MKLESWLEGILKVFISSVIGGMEEYRNAAADAIILLRHDAVRAEDFGASDASPRVACLGAVRNSDAVVLILGSRYGEVQVSGLSATHEEYREARDTRPVLVMVENGAEFEHQQQEFIDEVQDWNSGNYTQSFGTLSELKDGVTRALHELEMSLAKGSVDSDEMLERAIGSLEVEDGYSHSGPRLTIALVSGPCQTVLRPAEIESSALEQALLKIALFGSDPIFTSAKGTETEIDGKMLILEQDGRCVCIQEDGTVDLAADLPRSNGVMNAIIEEDVEESIESFIGFAVDVLDHVDETHRLSHSVVVANLLYVGYTSWRTRSEHAQSPNTTTVSWRVMSNPKIEPVYLTPPGKPRSALRLSASDIAEDLMVLLRRQLSD